MIMIGNHNLTCNDHLKSGSVWHPHFKIGSDTQFLFAIYLPDLGFYYIIIS